MKVNNSERDIKIRHYENTTIIVGVGTIVFSLWTVIKSFTVLFFRRELVLQEALDQYDELAEIPEPLILGVMAVMIFFAMILDLIIRVYVGRSAISEGRGRKKSRVYLFFTLILIAGSISTLFNMFTPKTAIENTELVKALGGETSLSSVIIELTSLTMMWEMFFSACRLRKLRKQDNTPEVG